MNEHESRLAISVDLDEWYHARWATGSKISRWPNPLSLFIEVYGLKHPRGDIDRPTREILLLFDEMKIKATFFILGEVAEYYPHLVKDISNNGHEVACHSYRHVDLWLHTPASFSRELKDAKTRLEDLCGNAIVGFRAPNLIVEDWILPILSELGFLYDSSVCPSRKIMGKFGRFRNLPQNPYRMAPGSFFPGNGDLVEIPIPVFPYIRLPAATGIMTRVIGVWWTVTALKAALKSGDSLYYFHPYELTDRPRINRLKLRDRLFARRTGEWMKNSLREIFNLCSAVPKATCFELAQKVLSMTQKEAIHERA